MQKQLAIGNLTVYLNKDTRALVYRYFEKHPLASTSGLVAAALRLYLRRYK